MMLRTGLAALALIGATVVTPPTAAADPVVFPEIIDEEELCVELTPHVASVETVPVRLDVRVLLDGTTRRKARTAVDAMRTAYDPLGISVRPSFERVSFKGASAPGLNRQAKRHYGGSRPSGTDVVYTLTSKDIAASVHGKNVAGLADCIGGVRFADRAFAVGEDFPRTITGATVPTTVHDPTSKTMAHEIGHLLGGHHHYFSPEGVLAEDPAAASLMGPSLSVIALIFSQQNSAMVRGHAQKYAD